MENNEQNQVVGNAKNLHPSTVAALQAIENKEEFISNVLNRLNVNLANHDYDTASKLADLLAVLVEQS